MFLSFFYAYILSKDNNGTVQRCSTEIKASKSQSAIDSEKWALDASVKFLVRTLRCGLSE